MIADGYNEELVQRYLNMQSLCDKQSFLTKELLSIAEELKAIPPMPKNLEKWMGSLPANDSKFKLSDFDRLFKVGRKYDKLIEERDNNTQKIKLIVIDNLIDRIKEVLGE